MEYSVLILLLPLSGFFFAGAGGTRLKGKSAGYVNTALLAAAALLAYGTAWQYFSLPRVEGVRQSLQPFRLEWMRFTEYLHIDLGILLDPISVMMLVVITTVSLMVHVYSLGYMEGEKGFQRYYAFLGLFTFSMCGLVVATNIFQMYIFWELVGVSSYLLIGFYYTKPEAVAASKKAFIVTRFADMFFLMGILLLSYYTKTFDFSLLCSGEAGIFAHAAGKTFLGGAVLSWAMGLIFIGAAGKSAMFPLHIWLPDAMEGPTPVSALIHAATMVVAGVFLVARLFPVYYFFTPGILHGIAYVAAFTALYAAIVACVQTDIKRVLAFSTISQIGFMLVALGVSGMEGHEGLGYMASMFHLFTHAMFKALLFLGAGAIIHTVHSNEMAEMGGLRKHMPVTHITFLVACLAIAGIPPLSGFFSKDEILSATFMFSPFLGTAMLLIAGLTAFYMFRLYYNIFWGKPAPHGHPLHEAPSSMTAPLLFLALLTVLAGFVPFGKLVSSDGTPYLIHLELNVATVSVLVALLAIFCARCLYRKGDSRIPAKMERFFGPWHKAAKHRFYIDEVYQFITHKIIFRCISKPLAWFDRHVIDGSLEGIASLAGKGNLAFRWMQNGSLQSYALLVISGCLLLTLWILLR